MGGRTGLEPFWGQKPGSTVGKIPCAGERGGLDRHRFFPTRPQAGGARAREKGAGASLGLAGGDGQRRVLGDEGSKPRAISLAPKP